MGHYLISTGSGYSGSRPGLAPLERKIVKILKEEIPAQQIKVIIQARIGHVAAKTAFDAQGQPTWEFYRLRHPHHCLGEHQSCEEGCLGEVLRR